MSRLEFHYDSDRDRIYHEPVGLAGWDLGAPPEEMNEKALCAAVASEILGCEIGWWGYYADWCCGCSRGLHACDSQCSALPGPNEILAWALPALIERDLLLKMASNIPDTLRHALQTIRDLRELELSNPGVEL